MNKNTGIRSTDSQVDANQTPKKSFADKAGNSIEKLGHKVSEAGAPKLGQKIHDAGDKLEEHHRNSRHPHGV